MQRIILHVDLDSFYASLEELRNEKIRGKPVVICVYSGRSEDSGAVSTANYKARELGIKAGMPIVFAKRLAKGGDVEFLPNDLEYYRSVSDRIMEMLEEETDLIQQVSIDEAYLDITERSFGNWQNAEKIAEKIKEKLMQEEGLTCTIGIGPNKFVAKMASGHKKPDGLTIVTNAQVKDFLENLPVSELHGIGNRTAEILNELGIRTASELANFDLQILEEKFGKNRAKTLKDKAQGTEDSPVEQKDIQQISRIGTLKEDTADLQLIYEKIKDLSIDMQRRIDKKDVTFRTVSIITIDTTLKMQTRTETIQMTGNMNEALEVVNSLLDKFFKENLGRKLRRVGIRVSNLTNKEHQEVSESLDKYFG